MIAAGLTVRSAPWDDTPPGPFIIELFTDRGHRRKGLARALVASVLQTTAAHQFGGVGLRVAEDNVAAQRLYDSMGFRPWKP